MKAHIKVFWDNGFRPRGKWFTKLTRDGKRVGFAVRLGKTWHLWMEP